MIQVHVTVEVNLREENITHLNLDCERLWFAKHTANQKGKENKNEIFGQYKFETWYFNMRQMQHLYLIIHT